MNYLKCKYRNRIIIAGIISITAGCLFKIIAPSNTLKCSIEMTAAAEKMKEAIMVIRNYCDEHNVSINRNLDPDLTGLIGPQHSEITTTLGHIEAKRSALNPNMAALLVYLLSKSGVKKGDRVALGASGSFPGLLIASVCAAEALELKPVTILSLGSSSYGASRVDLNLLKIYNILFNSGVFLKIPGAVSLGGEGDVGTDFSPEIKMKLMDEIKRSRIQFIFEPDLRKNIEKRMEIYHDSLSSGKTAAFINCGGGYANLGISSLILKVNPGLNFNLSLPEIDKRGVLFEMASKNVPCIHLLFIKGFVEKYNLAWDPIPLPEPDKNYNPEYDDHYKRTILFFTFGYFILIGLIFSVEILECISFIKCSKQNKKSKALPKKRR